ncbi:MAG: hypothetical protein EAZ44_00230 [Cytophagia bacterium]|nr:MAG: hypothetical protein EAY69_06725 [Cytophagales bacterium]TAG07546.1 MAG: hypothetical protein EAZ44_00230 [Cytophagia bacterium]TAG44658.1 MAG: hypothetical protein EAZ31_01995 [Cytophagia bacterium]
METFISIGIFYGFYHFFLVKDKSFERNRFFLLGSILFSILLPTWEFSAWQSPLSLQYLPNLIINQKNTAIINDIYFSWETIFFYLYWLITSILLGRFIFHLYLIFQKIARLPQIHKRGYILINTEGNWETFSFFNYIFWNNKQNLTEEEQDLVLYHEQRHIWDKHTIDVLLIEIIKIFFWFNPFVYLYAKALRLQHEYIADIGVLKETTPQNYGRLLLKNISQKLQIPFAHSFNQSDVKKRLLMMKENTFQLYFWQKLVASFLLMISICWLLAGKTPVINDENNRFVSVEGGLDKFYIEFKKVFQTPSHQLQGKIFVQFIINIDGTASDYTITRTINLNQEYEKEVLKAMKKVNVKWIPAKVNGKIVKQQMSLPIIF